MGIGSLERDLGRASEIVQIRWIGLGCTVSDPCCSQHRFPWLVWRKPIAYFCATDTDSLNFLDHFIFLAL